MATISYKASDGTTWSTENDGSVYETGLAGHKMLNQGDYEGAIERYTTAINATNRQYPAAPAVMPSYLGRARAYINLKRPSDAEKDILEVCFSGGGINENISCEVYYLLGICNYLHFERYNSYDKDLEWITVDECKENAIKAKEKAISDWKYSADKGNVYGCQFGNRSLDKLKALGISYSPKSSNASTSSSSYSDDYSSYSGSYDDKRNGFVSFLFGAVAGVGIMFTAGLIYNHFIGRGQSTLPIIPILVVLVAGLIVTLIAWRNRKYVLFFIMLALAVPGYLGLFEIIPQEPGASTRTLSIIRGSAAPTVTATVTGNANFRSGPSTNNSVIRQFSQGDTVTLTGETSGGWTQVTHNGDTGWVSSEFLNPSK